MALTFCSKRIHCTNCHYQGKERIRGAGLGATVAFLLLLTASFLYWPLFLPAGAVLVWIVCTPACSICPRCGWQHPIWIEQYEQQKDLAGSCPCLTGKSCLVRR